MAKIYRFDDVQVDLRNFRVLKAGKALPLEPKALNVLVFLIEQRGRLVEKRELMDAVWGDTAVTENVLSRAIAQLRKVLADDAKDARYIETVPTRGYRFIADLVVAENGDAQPVVSSRVEPVVLPPKASASSSPAVSAAQQPERSRANLRRYAMGTATAVVLVCLVIAVVLLVRRPSSRLLQGDGSEYLQIASNTQITTAQGLSFYPTFSPDGTSMAYSAERGKGFEIFVRQLQPGGQEVEITSDGGQNMQPAWSPDGKLIAFHSRQRGGIWLVPALGGTTRQVTEFGSHPAWSHDGQSLAFQAGALDDFSADSTGANPPSTLWVIRLDGGSPHPLTKQGYPEGGHGSPSWSPDGKHIVFVVSLYGGSWLWAVGSDGSGEVRLADRSSGYFDPVYSPDGKSVLYGAIAPGVNYGLWQVRVSPYTSAPLGESVEINNSGGTRIKNLAFSADGKRLLYAAIGLTGSLASLPIGKSGEPAGEPVALTTDVGCRSILPAFSPDGSRIAFDSCRGRPGLPQQVWLMNADGSHNQQLTPGPTSSSYPAWYPDGRRIFFKLGNNLFSIDPETRQQKLVMELDRNFGSLRPSPDGRQFVTDLSMGGVFNLWLVDAVTSRAKQLTSGKELCSYPVWSPDGKYIAAEVQQGEDIGIAILPSTGGPLTELTPYHSQQWIYSWSPDSDKIIYAKREDDSIWNIWSVSRSTKAEKRLTHYTRINAYVRYPAMSPRGNQIVYEYTETTGNIWMFEFK